MATRPQALHEAVASLAVAGRTGSGRLRVRIIEADRWGSSAYYPATVLKRDGSVFKAGTHTYFDHPTVTEAVERPERSVRDLAGRLVTDAEFDGDGLYAEMEVFPHYRDLVESMAGAIGLSIRAQGTVEYGEMAGRSGPILTAFTEAESVDFVTAPGAGGKIVALLESARALAEGRHSAPWREEDHPRGYHGRFGNGSGSGGSDGGSGGGSAGGGAPSGGAPASRSERGMPSVLGTTSVPLTGGGSARLDRHTSGDVSLTVGNHTTTLSRDNADTLVSRLRLADDWDVGDEESFGGAGHIRKTGRNEYEATLPDGTALNVTRRDVKQLEKAFDRLDGASRVDTGNGDADIFVTDDKKIGFRHLGDDGRPVEAAFTRGSFGKISRTIDELLDEADFPDDPDNPITRKVIATNLGKVRVELFGKLRDGPGSKLEIMPVEGDAWGVVVDSAQKYDWFHAMDQAASASGLTEARRSPAAEVPRGKAPPFQKTKDGDDEDPDEQDEDDKDDKDEDDEPEGSEDAKQKDKKLPAFLNAKESRHIEAANVGHWLESRLHRTFTELTDDMFGDGRLTREERIGLSQAVGDGLKAFAARVEADHPHLYQRDPWSTPEQGNQGATTENTTKKGAPMSGSTKEQTPPDRGEPTITESTRERQLAAELAEATNVAEAAKKALTEAQTETAARVAALEATVAESAARALRLENDKAARKVCAEALKGSSLPEAAHTKVAETVARDIPVGENGVLDGAKLAEAIKTAIQDEKVYLAAIAESTGLGAVRGLGESRREISESDIDSELEEAFKGLGMSDNAAKVAAHGRA